VVEAARAAIDRYRMLEEGETVVVGVSGGPDSMCLLDVLARLSSTHGYTLMVGHFDHALSEESEKIAARVAKVGAEAGFDAHVARGHDLHGPNLQARARELRYSFLETIALDNDATKVATGHTLDDRVETTIARLVHGASTGGLAGIPPAAGMRVRPLITVRRQETRDYCTQRGLEFVDDPANEDDRFERAAIRSTVLPAIEARWGDGAIRAIAAAADDLLDDAGALDLLADRLYKDLARTEGEETILALAPVMEIPRALRRRLLERAVGRIRDRSGGIDAALGALDRARTEGTFSVAGGIEITLSAGEVRVSRLPA
jgi:tRNA(Ile)-lysidine synthase